MARKIAFIGAGSYGFTYKLIVDILFKPELFDSEIAFMDVDEKRLKNLETVMTAHFNKVGYKQKPIYTTELKKALAKADFVVNLVKIGFYDASVKDMEIPKKYGLYQTIGDTCGVAGISRGLRTMIFDIGMVKMIEKVSRPNVMVINYSNPQQMSVTAVDAVSDVPFIGLCHSVQGTTTKIAESLGIPYDELTYEAAGTNHMNWILKLRHKRKDVYPRFRKLGLEDADGLDKGGASGDPAIFAGFGKTRIDMLNRTGYMVTESSHHFAEYVPYYLRTPELIKKYDLPIDMYVDNIARKDKAYAEYVKQAKKGKLPDEKPSVEYGSQIIEAVTTNRPAKIYANVMNWNGYVENLPYFGCVEVASLVDRNGVQPIHFGEIPHQLAALCSANMNVHKLAAEAVLRNDRDYVYWAFMADMAAHSVMDLDQMRALADEILDAQEPYLNGYFKK